MAFNRTIAESDLELEAMTALSDMGIGSFDDPFCSSLSLDDDDDIYGEEF
jgi:hypothetical protein